MFVNNRQLPRDGPKQQLHDGCGGLALDKGVLVALEGGTGTRGKGGQTVDGRVLVVGLSADSTVRQNVSKDSAEAGHWADASPWLPCVSIGV